jgi:hypothetical protein
MKLEPAFVDAARLLTSFALDPSLQIRFSDQHLHLHSAYERALALHRIGGPRHRLARIAALRLARAVAAARAAVDASRPLAA